MGGDHKKTRRGKKKKKQGCTNDVSNSELVFAPPSRDVCPPLDLDCAHVSCTSVNSLGDQSCDEFTEAEYLAQSAVCMVQRSDDGNLVCEGNYPLPAQLGVPSDPVFLDAHDDDSPLWKLQTARHS